jgi:transcriptional regulator with XRE-family HTH domain
MSLISENLKQLRKKKGLTQEQMAQEVGIKRSLLGAYEEGRAEPRIGTLLKFAELFSMPIEQIINNDQANEGKVTTTTKAQTTNGQKLKVLSITTDRQGRENIELVPQKAAAGYLNGYADPEYIEELPKFQLPMLPGNATYRAFEISGDSMLPLRSGTIIIGQFIENVSSLKNGKAYVLVTRDEGIVYKRIYRYSDNPELFCMVSDNRQYSTYDVKASDILEIWESKAFISMQLPDPDTDDTLSLKKLGEIVLDLQQEVIKLKGK